LALLTTSDYPAVRAALDTSLDDGDLPDGIIGLSIYQGRAEAFVLRRDPLAQTRTGADAQHVKNAAIFLTAGYLAPALPAVISDDYGDHRMQRKPMDWIARGQLLTQRGEAELDVLLLPPALLVTSARPRMFTVASGSRGR